MASAASKRCSHCGGTKPLSEFHRRRKARDGRDTTCRKCRAEYARTPAVRAAKARWADAHREEESERKRRWDREHAAACSHCGRPLSDPYIKGPECRDCRETAQWVATRDRIARELALRYKGLSNHEIAAQLGTTASSVATRLQRRSVEAYGFEWIRSPYKRRVAGSV